MVKNNEWAIPKNIDKPVETVYELKGNEYKVPSFEEFMKSYENDGSLNYDDLNGGGVGEVEGYGPCSPSSCYSCSCSRSDCNCQSGERWCNLRLACPICPVGGSNYVREWGHAICPGYGVRISNQARIRCNKSYCRTAEINRWNFVCSNHDGQAIEKNGSFARAILTVMNAKNNAYGADEKLLTELLIYMETHTWSQGY